MRVCFKELKAGQRNERFAGDSWVGESAVCYSYVDLIISSGVMLKCQNVLLSIQPIRCS